MENGIGKTINYNSYHELAYLHPNHFTPNYNVVKEHIKNDDNFFIIRFSKLNAYHDSGISGIDIESAKKIVEMLKPFGRILITSERELPDSLEMYRFNIKPEVIHHFLAFAKLYIGDSQTMAAESGVLGTPFIRVNDFVGRLGYLNELENKYKLGYGFKPDNIQEMFKSIQEILDMSNSESEWKKRKEIMLNDKIDFAEFLFNYIVNYRN